MREREEKIRRKSPTAGRVRTVHGETLKTKRVVGTYEETYKTKTSVDGETYKTERNVRHALTLEWKPEDCWIGFFWRGSLFQEEKPFDVWVCILPMVPLHYTRWKE